MPDPRQLPRETTAGMSVEQAELLARNAHGVQQDRGGSLHIEHVARVAAMVPERHRRVAWLHDVVEDTPVTLSDLRMAGLPEDEADAVALLTRPSGASYAAYIEALADGCDCDAHLSALAVKEADLLDNLARCIRADDDAAYRYRAALRTIYNDTV